jgi:hypothetical protein
MRFAREVARGSSQSDAYREAYDAENMQPATIHNKASALMADGRVRARVDWLIKERDRGMIASSLSDRERVLRLLRDWTESATPQDSNKLRAAELLGKASGMFKEVTLDADPVESMSAEEIKEALSRRIMQMLSDGEAGNDPQA